MSRTDKIKHTIEFCIFELVKVPIFSLNVHFPFFGANLPKKGNSNQNQKKFKLPLNFAYLDKSRHQISELIDNFEYLHEICQKRHVLKQEK